MFFMLERRKEGRWEQVGIVVAANIEAAAAKLGKEIVVEEGASIPFGFLQGGEYCLAGYPEIEAIP